MKRLLIPTFAIALLLALPAGAQARVVELGAGAQPPAQSNCPDFPCVAAYQVTAYQGRSGTLKNPFVVPRAGKIVAFTVSLGGLTADQVAFFNGRFGDGASVRLSILRRGTRRGKKGNHRLMSQSKIYDVDSFLGSSPTFALDEPLRVQKNYRVALTIPTWAPVLDTIDLDGGNWWRASRPKGKCAKKDTDPPSPPSAQQMVGDVVDYGCTYFKSRLLYTATYIPDPRPTDGSDKKRKSKRSRQPTAKRSSSGPFIAMRGGALAP